MPVIVAPAAAMGMMIVYTAAGVKILHWLVTRAVHHRTQKWRTDTASEA